MDLDRLCEFVLIAEKKSIKIAAGELGIAPATLASRLKNFEASLGTALFHRESSGLTLTQDGQHFYANVYGVVSQYRKLKNDIGLLSNDALNELRICILGSGMPFHLGPYLDILNKQNPNIKLHLLDASRFSIEESLRSGEIDVYFAPVMSHLAYNGIVKTVLAPPHQNVLLPADHPLAQQESLSLSELENECFLLYPQSGAAVVREFQLENLKAAKIHYSTLETDSSPFFYHLLVPIGKGIVLSPSPVLNGVPNCASIPVTGLAYPAPDSMLYLKDNRKKDVTNFVSGFLNFIKEGPLHEHRKAL
jgi:DNA-binding transcriptional LysR family regulator